MKRVVLIGSDGMLGRAFTAELDAGGYAHLDLDRPRIDLNDRATLSVITSEVDLVVCCAAWTDVDGAETHEAEATAVNGTGTGHLAEHCGTVGATLLHFSTDYVFAGDATEPYRTDAPLQPLNAYGRSKAVGEEAIRESGADHLIVRTSWLYAPWANNFVLTMKKLTAERDELRVVDDQRGRPTSAEHLARTSLALYEDGARGTFHVTDGGECTWHELAAFVASRVNPDCRVLPCSSAEFPRPALRPAYSVLDLSTTEQRLGPMGAWRDHVDAALAKS